MTLNFLIPTLLAVSGTFAHAGKFECAALLLSPLIEQTYSNTPIADFHLRDTLPRTEAPRARWNSDYGKYGPCALPYPKVIFPDDADRILFSRIRIIAAAKKFLGVRYAHFHIPEMGGLDCSNFTALAYNYAFGIRFTSNIERQAQTVGRLLRKDENLQPGDLIFIFGSNDGRISHVAMYVSNNQIIDSTGPGVELRPFAGRYKSNYAWARRLIE